jgi:endonuclease/exonuclease/phosphatase family metal-dependent hydrolase
VKTLTVLSYNIHKGFDVTNRRFVLAEIREAIRSVDADLVLLQEVQGEHRSRAIRVEDWCHEPHAEYLAREHWPHVIYGQTAKHRNGHHGNAILSRFEVESWTNTNISTNLFEARGLLHAVVREPFDNREIHCMCVHLDLFKRGRTRQLSAIGQSITSSVPAEAALILGGDFNDWSKAASSYLDTKHGLHEAFGQLNEGLHAPTFPAALPVLTLDRLYFRNLQVRSIEVLVGRPWSRLSDHAPLLARFDIVEKIT